MVMDNLNKDHILNKFSIKFGVFVEWNFKNSVRNVRSVFSCIFDFVFDKTEFIGNLIDLLFNKIHIQ